MNVFLDGSTNPSDVYKYMRLRIGKKAEAYTDKKWNIVRNYAEFTSFVKKHGIPDLISFGHDFTEEHYEILCACGSSEDFPEKFNEETGYDCAVWIIDFYLKNGGKFPDYMVHSMNPYGAEKINNYLASYKKQFVISE